MKNDKYRELREFYFADSIEKDLPDKIHQCLVFGNFGAMNLGDEAILAGEIEELKKIKNINITVASRNPLEINRLHGTESVSIFNLPGIIGKIVKSEFVLVGGGGIICKADRNLYGLMYQFYMLFLYLILPQLFRKRIYVVGIGIYNNANNLVLALSTYLLRFVRLLTVRDYHSLEYLNSKSSTNLVLGKGIQAMLYKDNSYLMDLDTKADVLRDEFFKKNYDSNKKNIGLALLQPENKNDEHHLISEVKKLISKNYKTTNFWFYACDYQDNFFNDKVFAKKIYTEFSDSNSQKQSIFIVPTNFYPSKLFASFKLMDYLIAMRLHGAIFAYRNNIDFLGITYDEKTSSFLDSIGKKPILIKEVSLENL